jgi:hypothetical protein
MSKEDWVWMPHPAHFICGHMCRFVLSTKVTGPYIVSTVGEYVVPYVLMQHRAAARGKDLKGDYLEAWYLKEFGFEEIGYNRKYETMVFRAVRQEEGCCPWTIEVAEDLDFKGYNTAKDAYEGHLELCNIWDGKDES